MSRTIELRWIDNDGKPKDAARFQLYLQGFDVGKVVTVEIWEVDKHSHYPAHGDQMIGSIKGTVTPLEKDSIRQVLKSTSATNVAQGATDPVVSIVVEQPGLGKSYAFRPYSSDSHPASHPADSWEIRARLEKEPSIRSGIYYISRQDKRAPEIHATYRWHGGHQVGFYNNSSKDPDGLEKGGYLRDLTDAIADARHFIFIADWSFHPYLHLTPKDPRTVGKILTDFCLADPTRIVAIHTWDHTAPLGMGAYDPQNDDGERMLDDISWPGGGKPGLLDSIVQAVGGAKHKPKNLLWRASSRCGDWLDIPAQGLSHHQKFVVLDAPCPWDKKRRVLRVFIGGIDITQGRFDWHEHPILPADADSAIEPLLKVTDHVKLTYKQRAGLEPDFPIHNWYTAEFGDSTPIKFSEKTGARKLIEKGLGLLDKAVGNIPHADWIENELAARIPLLVNKDDPKFHPREPWHDIHSSITGPCGWDVVREFIGRWNLDPGGPLFKADGDRSADGKKKLVELLKTELFDKAKFVQQWEFHKWEDKAVWNAQLLRSLVKDHWGTDKPLVSPAAHKKDRTEFVWSVKNGKFERSIQDSYLRAIAQAEKFIYIETQYFIGKPRAANTMPDALADRIAQKHEKGEPFHVYIILPMFPEGDPASIPYQLQRSFQWRTINRLVRLVQKKTGDWKSYLTIGYLANWSDPDDPGPKDTDTRITKARKNHRYMIYVHSKLMIVDDRYMIVGSANLNERSLGGDRDSEICMGIWPGPGSVTDCESALRDFRKELWAEHFGSSPADPDNPQLPQNAKAIQKQAETNALLMRHHEADGSKNGHFCTWFIDGDQEDLGIFGQEHIRGPGTPTGKNNLGYIVDGVKPDKLSKQVKDFLDTNSLTKDKAKEVEDEINKKLQPAQNVINSVPGLSAAENQLEEKVQTFAEGAPGAEYLVWPGKFLELSAFELIGGKSLE